MNHGTYLVNLTKAPEQRKVGETTITRIRVADNTFPKDKTVTRFFNAEFRGRDGGDAMKLSSGDQVLIAGTLKRVKYKAKGGPNKGKWVEDDEMPFAQLLQVVKSESFFGAAKEEAEPADDGEPEGAEGDEPAEGADDPMADLRA